MSPRILRRLVVALALTVGVGVLATPASAGPKTGLNAVAAAPGAISGHLTDAGTPVAGATVELLISVYPFFALAHTSTDAAGSFRLDGVQPGSYKLKFILPGSLVQFFSQKTTVEEAAVVTVPDGAEIVVEETVVPHGSLAGRITTSTGAAADGALLNLYTVGGFVPAGTATADANGDYLFPYVAAGTYNLQVGRASRSAPFQWVHQRKTKAQADPVTVTVGPRTVLNEQLLPLGVISGSYRDASGPVANVVVTALSQTTPAENIVASTGADGTFSLYAYPGPYKVKFQPPGQTLEQWGRAKENERDADVLTLAANADLALNETALPTGTAQGLLADADGQPIAFGSVELQDPVRDRFFGGFTDENGHYSVLARTGTYKVELGADNQVQWFPNSLTQAGGATVTILAARTTTVNGTMLRPGSLNVTAVDAGTGAPITSFCAIADNATIAASACTDDGTVEIDPLGPGTYAVRSSDGVHLDGTTDGVRVTSGRTASATTRLVTPATIELNLVDSQTGEPVESACATTFTPDHPFVPGDGNGGCSAGGVITMERVKPDRYQLFVNTFDGTHGSQWVGPSGGVGSQARASVFTARPGVTSRFTVKVDGRGSIAGVITDRVTRAPVEGAVITAGGTTAVSGADGRYELTDLGPYQWPLLFSQEDYAAQWSGGGNNRLTATAVRVRTSQTTQYDATLRKGTTLTGRILGPNGARPESATVTVINATTFDTMGHADLAPDGTYTVHVLGPQPVGLQVEATLRNRYQLGWYDRAADFAHATTVQIPATGTRILNITTR